MSFKEYLNEQFGEGELNESANYKDNPTDITNARKLVTALKGSVRHRQNVWGAPSNHGANKFSYVKSPFTRNHAAISMTSMVDMGSKMMGEMMTIFCYVIDGQIHFPEISSNILLPGPPVVPFEEFYNLTRGSKSKVDPKEDEESVEVE